MAQDNIDYQKLTQTALRGVVKSALEIAATDGLPGEHHFFVAFSTGAPGVNISTRLRERYPEEMTIVLQHQYWGLEVGPDKFTIKLSFNNIPETLIVPYAAVKGFLDPSVQFGLQFDAPATAASPVEAASTASTALSESANSDSASSESANSENASTDTAGPGDEGPESEPKSESDANQAAGVVSLDAFRKK